MKAWQLRLVSAIRPLTRTWVWKRGVYFATLATVLNQDVGDPVVISLGESLASLPGRVGTYSPPIAMRYFVRRGHMQYTYSKDMSDVRAVNGRIKFEDLTWLFQCCPANRGIITMDFDEAAYLYKTAQSLHNAQIVEIGRYKGGSTFLLASAADKASRVISFDLHIAIQAPRGLRGAELDEELMHALRISGLAHKVELIVADSHSYKVVPASCDLIFIDGDHTYSGVKADYENWKAAIKPGGHLLFHDAANAREYSSYRESIGQLMQEIEELDSRSFVKQSGVGSLVHFIRTPY